MSWPSTAIMRSLSTRFSSRSPSTSWRSFIFSTRFHVFSSTLSCRFSPSSICRSFCSFRSSRSRASIDAAMMSLSARSLRVCSSRAPCCDPMFRTSSSCVASFRTSSFCAISLVSSSDRSVRTVSSAFSRCSTNSSRSAWCFRSNSALSFCSWTSIDLTVSSSCCECRALSCSVLISCPFSASSEEASCPFRLLSSLSSCFCASMVPLASSSARSVSDSTSWCRTDAIRASACSVSIVLRWRSVSPCRRATSLLAISSSDKACWSCVCCSRKR
mmetsp:Transcript_38054/g.76958  ORF Transcript_38054/g.76958 Transcript_38054/m.76958 type:complete len:273 (+) Transcript_38054:660-1478(+)